MASAVVSCSSDNTPDVLQVPTKYTTIQSAIDAASTGDIVEIQPGIYNESISIKTDGIVVRGMDRNKVVIDGGNSLANGFFIAANSVRIENLTVRSFLQNGIVFSGIDVAERTNDESENMAYGTPSASLDGFEVRWVTVYNNGLYGIYAFASRNGLISDSLVSGHPDSGIYIGQCKPCTTIVQRVISEFNAIGYYGTNASGDVYVISSIFRNNRLGIAPNSQRAELLYPQEETFVVGNYVHDNDDPRAPAIMEGFFGGGIVIGGGTRNLVKRNRVEDHDYVGIAILDFNDFTPSNNQIRENTALNNGIDLAISVTTKNSNLGNCFSENAFKSSAPQQIQDVLPCAEPQKAIVKTNISPLSPPPNVNYRNIPAPQIQKTMPTIEFLRPAGVTQFIKPQIETIKVP